MVRREGCWERVGREDKDGEVSEGGGEGVEEREAIEGGRERWREAGGVVRGGR